MTTMLKNYIHESNERINKLTDVEISYIGFHKWEKFSYVADDWSYRFNPKTNQCVFYYQGKKEFSKKVVPYMWYEFDLINGELKVLQAPKSFKVKPVWEYGFYIDTYDNTVKRINISEKPEYQALENGWTRITCPDMDKLYKIKYSNGKAKIIAVFNLEKREAESCWFDSDVTVTEMYNFFNGFEESAKQSGCSYKMLIWLYR